MTAPARDRWLASETDSFTSLAGRPALAAVSFAESGGGVAYVGRLLAQAIRDAADHPLWAAELVREGRESGTTSDRLTFLARVLAAQVARRADWIVFNHVGIARAQSLLPAVSRLPYAVFLHGVEVWGRPLSRGRRRILRKATLRLSNSSYTSQRVMMEHPDVGMVRPCPLGLLPGMPTGLADDPSCSVLQRIRARSALIVGRMNAEERYKGHDELIESWSDVRVRVPDAQLVIVGEGDDVERLRGKAAALGVSDAVVFTGYVDQATLSAIRDRVAVFAMPSRGEGFGIVYLEAMRAGLPCIGSTDDAAGDVIDHGRTGLLVSQRERAALVDAVCALLADEDLRRRMGEAGRERVAREFTYERFRDRVVPLLAEAFGRSSRGSS